jgi:2-keto-3-deoxy-L-rhamnonate aldolase RhmA
MAKQSTLSSHMTAATDAPGVGIGRRLKQRLKSGEVLVGGIASEYIRPSLVKLYLQAGFDFLYIEYEHGFLSPTALVDTVLCARDNGLPVIAKTPQLERAEVAKLLESGIIGIQSSVAHSSSRRRTSWG